MNKKNKTLYIYWVHKTGVFENYFHLKQQMPTTSGFAGNSFSPYDNTLFWSSLRCGLGTLLRKG